MPYEWSAAELSAGPGRRLCLWPHRSLPRRGFAIVILVTFGFITLPLYPLLGTAALWGLLPFLMLAVAGMWWAFERSDRDGRLREVLTIDPERVRLTRTEPGGETREWDCESHWTRARLYEAGGPVSYYLTLGGRGREVEIGAFLSETERRALFAELSAALRQAVRPGGGR